MRPATAFMAVVMVLLCGPIAGAQQAADGGTFQAAVSHSAGQYPWWVAVGNFNDDGNPDLVAANLGTGVSVLLANGSGSFQAPTRYLTGYAQSVAVGDLNDDGKDDLVVPNRYDYLTVLLNRGDGTFGAPTNYAMSSDWVAVGDFNEDGRADLAVAFGTVGGVGVMLSNGDGTLQTPVIYSVSPLHPRGVAVGDFNEDTHADLVATGYSGLTVLWGNGDGTLVAPSPVADFEGDSVVTGDFDGDGTLDLAATGLYPFVVWVVLGNGDGTFRPPVSYGRDLSPIAIAAGDFNRDGRDDLAVVASVWNAKSGRLVDADIAVMLAEEGGTLQPAIHYGAGWVPRSVAVGDFDTDGKIDLAVANSSTFDVSVLLNGPVTTTTTMHVGDIDGHVKQGPDLATWQALLVVRFETDSRAAPTGTIVTGSWDDGTTGSCVTGLAGTCKVFRPGIPVTTAAVSFQVTVIANPAYPEYGYDPTGNHDPDGDSDGTTIVLQRP